MIHKTGTGLFFYFVNFTLSPCHLVTLSPCHLVTLLPCNFNPCFKSLLISVVILALEFDVHKIKIMNKKVKKLLMFSVMPIIALLLMSANGNGKDGSKKGPDGGGSGCVVKESDTEVTLFSMYQMPPGRINNWAVPVYPSLWSGASSATGLFGDADKYYCVITISSNCNDYNREYVWDPDTQGGTTMTIPVPENDQFRINVEYWEQCGPYWGSSNSPTYARGLWFSEITQNYSSNISISSWIYLRRENC